VLAGVAASAADADARVRRALDDGSGLERFRAIIAAQQGDPAVVDDYGRLPQPREVDLWRAPRAGCVQSVDAELVGRAAVVLGAGRDRVDAEVDPGAGIDVLAARGTRVDAGQPVLRLAAASSARLDAARALLQNAVDIGDGEPEPTRLVLDVMTPDL
jgi:pyrimidine-nucleoside phosphorylase